VSDFLADWSRTQPPSFLPFRIVGRQWEPSSHRLRDILTRLAFPYRFYPPDSEEGRQLLAEAGQDDSRLPVVIFRTGQVLVDPSHAELAELLGASIHPQHDRYDLAIVGAGPAGLAAAVSAASEGLRTLVVEPEVFGGQAGTSSLIRNYPGFAHGIRRRSGDCPLHLGDCVRPREAPHGAASRRRLDGIQRSGLVPHQGLRLVLGEPPDATESGGPRARSSRPHGCRWRDWVS
jgi:FAD dependent oxidoreductase